MHWSLDCFGNWLSASGDYEMPARSWKPSRDREQCQRMLAQIDDDELRAEILDELAAVLAWYGMSGQWHLVNAMPYQRCLAVYRVLLRREPVSPVSHPEWAVG